MDIKNILLDGAAQGANNASDGSTQMITTVIMLAAMAAIFYFFIYRPQKKQEKATADMRNGIQVGDEITTIGGIIGKVISMKEETLVIETSGDKTKMRILKSAVRNIDVHAEDAKD